MAVPVSLMQGSAKGAPGLRGKPFSMKLAGVPSGLKLGCKRCFVIDHRGDFSSASGFGNRHCDGRQQFLAEIETGFDVVRSAADDDVTRQTAVINRIERRMRWTVTSHSRTEERIARHGCGWHRRHRQRRQAARALVLACRR